MGRRVKGSKASLDYKKIQEFFENRGRGKGLKSKYNYVLYQDDCPGLAEKRDAWEKEKISGLLCLEKGQRVLDIGCGIGRWGELLLEKGLYYTGIDGSPRMVQMAEENLEAYPGKKLMAGMFQGFRACLEEAGETEAFDKVFVNGVFMYLNDGDYLQALKDIHCICAPHCEVYIKESMGTEGRLTLDNVYSGSLSQDYSAVYRATSEYRQTLSEEFSSDFTLVSEGRLFPAEMENRAETTDYYFIWRR